ncbi:hypothetical protein RHGRI_015208 [Rhododendron griersonianum]|uniref:Integral membrane bound transporter domain-containing protein n=1 Tax=Rhododendron griersonianum TaxID=479676 RepID=A0AAV6KCZ1_9ERIC|nr:hypothetical protein RHGRI_015208 [Rhododendron griersonianum]
MRMSGRAYFFPAMTAEEDQARAIWRTRLGSAFRTALACAMVGCATLYGPEPLRTQLPFPAFAYVTAILIVLDATVGDSVKGCWHALLATAQVLPTSVVSLWLIGPEHFSPAVAAAAVAAGAFMVAVPEWSHLMTKRIAFGQIVIVYVGAVVYGKEAGDVMHPIHVAASTALGALASVLAMLLPYPRLAYAEVILACMRDLRYSDLMVNKLSRLYTQNASERISLLMKAFSAQNTTIALETISQAKPLQETGAKLLQRIKLIQSPRTCGGEPFGATPKERSMIPPLYDSRDYIVDLAGDKKILLTPVKLAEAKKKHKFHSEQESVQWERHQIRQKPHFRKPGDRLQDIEILIRGMEMALTCCSSFPISFIDEELQEILLAMEGQIGQKLEQVKCIPTLLDASTAPEPTKGELFNKFLDSLKVIDPNSGNQTAFFFFLSCIELLLDDSTITQQNPTRIVEKSKDEESRNSVQEAKNMFKQIWPKNETLLFAFKCSISLGLAVFFGLVFNKENGYWSGLTIAISFSAQRQATFREANARAQGTALGSVYGVLGCYFFSECLELRILALLPWIVLTTFLRHSKMYGQAGGVSTVIGALLILGRKNYGLPAEFAITRLTEAFIGLFCFIIVELLLQPTRAATLAKKQLSQSLGALREGIRQVGLSPDEKDMDIVFLTLREKQEKLKVHVNQLKKFAGESELEPNFWFLPFQTACYNKLLMSISKMVDLQLFMAVQMESLVEESRRCGVAWRDLQERINSDLDLFKKGVSSSLHFLEKITLIESFSVFERKDKEVYDDLELGKSSNEDVCIVAVEKIASFFLYHSNEVTEKLWANKEGEERRASQMALRQSAVRFCISGLMKETKEIEKGIKELVQWENPSTRMNFYEISRKISVLFPE